MAWTAERRKKSDQTWVKVFVGGRGLAKRGLWTAERDKSGSGSTI